MVKGGLLEEIAIQPNPTGSIEEHFIIGQGSLVNEDRKKTQKPVETAVPQNQKHKKYISA